MSKEKKRLAFGYALVMPAFLVVMLVVAWPIVTAVQKSFTDPETGGFTFANYAYFFTDPNQLKNIFFTMFVCVATVAIAIVVAYLLALYLRFVKSPIARLVGNLYLIPRFVPSLVAVYAMITIIRDSGLINRISLLFGGDLKLGVRYAPRCIALLAGLAVIALGVNLVLDTNFMFLMEAEPGNPLYIFGQLWGDHRLGFAVLIPAILAVMYAPLELARKIRKK